MSDRRRRTERRGELVLRSEAEGPFDDSGPGGVIAVDAPGDHYSRKHPAADDPFVRVAKSLTALKIIIGMLAVPVIATGKIVITYVIAQTENETAAKIERARMLKDLEDQKLLNETQARAIRDAEEALRRHQDRLQDLLSDRSRQRVNK